MQKLTINLSRFVASALVLLAGPAAQAADPEAPDAQAVLAAGDAIRNPSQPFSITVSLAEYTKGKQTDAAAVQVYSRVEAASGQFRSLIRWNAPARDAGKLMLKTGNDLWFFDPASKASVRISPQQRLLGPASNGDVVTINYAKAYTARYEKTEEVADGDRQPRKAHKLLLAAAAPDVTYHSVEMWVDVTNNRPIKTRLFSESQRLLKTAFFRDYREEMGGVRPTEIVIIDGLNPDIVTVMKYGKFGARDVPESWFQRDFLPRFSPE